MTTLRLSLPWMTVCLASLPATDTFVFPLQTPIRKDDDLDDTRFPNDYIFVEKDTIVPWSRLLTSLRVLPSNRRWQPFSLWTSAMVH